MLKLSLPPVDDSPRKMLNKLCDDFLASASDDFVACMLSGVEMQTTSEVTPTGVKITMSTKNPVAVQRIAGRTWVMERRDAQ